MGDERMNKTGYNTIRNAIIDAQLFGDITRDEYNILRNLIRTLLDGEEE